MRAKHAAVDESVVNRGSAGLSTTVSTGQGRGGQGRDGSSSSRAEVKVEEVKVVTALAAARRPWRVCSVTARQSVDTVHSNAVRPRTPAPLLRAGFKDGGKLGSRPGACTTKGPPHKKNSTKNYYLKKHKNT